MVREKAMKEISVPVSSVAFYIKKGRLCNFKRKIMAVYRAKIEELLRLIPDLQCHKCKDVPGTVFNLDTPTYLILGVLLEF